MKEFMENSGWREKVNFVDVNNTFVGYDLSQDCCEDADYYYSDKIPVSHRENEITPSEEELSSYIFNKCFFEYIETTECDQGLEAAFKLEAKDKKDIYLVIYNHHNGHNAHGFDFGYKNAKDQTFTIEKGHL